MLFKNYFKSIFIPLVASALVIPCLNAQSNEARDSIIEGFAKKLNFRMIGPATTSGRIIDLAVNPKDHSEYYVASAYGGVWKTSNAGGTFTPIFDKYGTQSIGCISLDPKNPNIVWVGTGENNNQRSVGYGNGLYKSEDGGKSFELVGLKSSFSIGMITIDKENSNIVWVAAYGNLWGDGGERGIYKTEDGGKTWKRKLHVSDKTGFNEVHIDPFNPSLMYATSHQRRRHQWTYLGGGPESAMYISKDGGENWVKASNGFPGGELGRISVECSETTAGQLTAIVEGASGGVFQSMDYGASWEKVNAYQTSGNYYQEVFSDPNNGNRLFFMDTYLHFSEDGGKTVKRFPEKFKHVDNHAIWIDPSDFKHLLVGCDGGLYETFDYGENWDFKENLPVTQFYRVSVDHSKPFYHVYGGTQDNYSLGGPSRNKTNNGISNEEWYVTVGGDGFKSQIDWEDPNTVYSQWQYGGLIRFNRITGESIDIKPRVSEALRWNWDAPLIISKYDSKKLYFAANKVFVSRNRGDKWELISGDLSRNIDRNELPVMGKIWGLETVAKNKSTSIYGNITYLVEGKKGELVVGTDDGFIYRTIDDGKNWSLIGDGNYPGTPNWKHKAENKVGKMVEHEVFPYVSSLQITKSGRIYAVLDNHKQGDFASHLVYYEDGKWKETGKGLPTNEPAKSLLVDPVDNDIVILGSEFGLYISWDASQNFTSFTNNMPPVAIKDIVYQSDEQDLVLATFGRGFAICDEYEKIRALKSNFSNSVSTDEHKLFIPYSHLGRSGNGFHGSSRFRGENLDEKVNLYFHLGELEKSLKAQRKEKEKEAEDLDQIYPSKKSIREEALEISNAYYLSVYNEQDEAVAQWSIKPQKGWNKTTWDLRYSFPASMTKGPLSDKLEGPYVNEGKYYWLVSKWEAKTGEWIDLISKDSLSLKYLFKENSLDENQKNERWANIQKLRNVHTELLKVGYKINELNREVTQSLKGIMVMESNASEIKAIQVKILKPMNAALEIINGENILSKYEFETAESIKSQLMNASWSLKESFEAPTQTHMMVADKALQATVTLNEGYVQWNKTWEKYKEILELE